jgi:hypothetical protein
MGGCQLELRLSIVQGATVLRGAGSASAQMGVPRDMAVWGAARRPTILPAAAAPRSLCAIR